MINEKIENLLKQIQAYFEGLSFGNENLKTDLELFQTLQIPADKEIIAFSEKSAKERIKVFKDIVQDIEKLQMFCIGMSVKDNSNYIYNLLVDLKREFEKTIDLNEEWIKNYEAERWENDKRKT